MSLVGLKMIDPMILAKRDIAEHERRRLIREIEASKHEPEDLLLRLEAHESALSLLEYDIRRGWYGTP